MTIDYRAHFALERQIKRCALQAGLAKPRAAQLAQQLACRPLRRHEAARLLALVALRRKEQA